MHDAASSRPVISPYLAPSVAMAVGGSEAQMIELVCDDDDDITVRLPSADVGEGQLGIAFPERRNEEAANSGFFISDNWTLRNATQRNATQRNAENCHARPMPKTQSIPPEVGENIARLRREKGIGPTQFASMVGIKRSTLYRIERGAAPRAETLKRIADHLGVPVEMLEAGGEASEHGSTDGVHPQG